MSEILKETDATETLKQYQTDAHAFFEKDMVLNMPPGTGKSLVATTILKELYASNRKNFKMTTVNFVFVFSENLKEQWKTKLEKIRIQGMEYNIINLNSNEEAKKAIEYASIKIGEREAKNWPLQKRFVVVDECHLLSTLPIEMLSQVMRVAQEAQNCLFMSGTVFGDGIEPFLPPLAACIPNFPLTAPEFIKRYYYTPLHRKVFNGWLVNSLAVRVGAFMILTRALETADFYASFSKGYYVKKANVVRYVTDALGPLFDREIRDSEEPFKRLQGAGLFKLTRSVVSMMVYFTLMTPFSFIVPTVVCQVKVEDSFKMKKLNKKRLAKDIQDVFYTPVVGDAKVAVLRPKRLTYYLDKNQIKMLVRMVHGKGRLTPREIQLITGEPTDESQTNFRERLQSASLDTNFFLNEGQIVSNIEFTQDDLDAIRRERRKMLSNAPLLGGGVVKVDQNKVQKPTAVKPNEENGRTGKNTGFDRKKEIVSKILDENERVMIFTKLYDDKKTTYSMLTYLRDEIGAILYEGSQSANVYNKGRRYDKTRKNVVVFPQRDMEGIDGFLETDAVIFLEPISSKALYTQLVGRASRLGSHEVVERKAVKVYELVSKVPLFTKTNESIKEWFKTNKDVVYFSRDRVDINSVSRRFTQLESKSPDQLALTIRAQEDARHKKIVDAVRKQQLAQKKKAVLI